jgi:hypothetical protein
MRLVRSKGNRGEDDECQGNHYLVANQALVADQVVSDRGKQTSAARLLTAGIDKPLEIIEPTRREAVPVEGGGSKAK